MTDIQLFAYCTIAFGALLFGVTRFMRFLGVGRIAWALPSAYLALLGIVFLLSYPQRSLPLAGILWLLPFVLALPSSLLVFVFGRGSDARFVISLAVYGCLQYFVLGWVIDRMRRRRTEQERT